MKSVYFEQRVSSARGTASQAADLMRHLHTRQYLGRAVIICEQPVAMLSAIRKQWLKLSRTIQYRRSETLNVDKILKYTHAITRMQRMHFTSKSTADWSTADVYCLSPSQEILLPSQCYSVYVTAPLSSSIATLLSEQLPNGGLIVDYTNTFSWQSIGLQPKLRIENLVEENWQAVEDFLRKYNIEPNNLFSGNIHNIKSMDEALDILLDVSKPFMQLADDFHKTLALARPLKITKSTRMKYDALSLLAHRVQALSPGEYTQRFLETYNEDDSMFLYDISADSPFTLEQLEELIVLHKNLGHQNIAKAYSMMHGKLQSHFGLLSVL